MATWQCVKSCGACCFLAPEERPELENYLTPAQIDQYMGLVGPAGWCVHYDADQRLCTIYDHRPDFCRVTPQTFRAMFNIAAADLNDFAIDCCREHIGDIYGEASLEMGRFNQAVDR